MNQQADRRRRLWICLGLAGLTLLTFARLLGNGFVSLDDTAYITENPRVLSGLAWPNIQWAFTTGYFGNWHPLTWLSHMLDVQLFGLNPGLHHLHSVVLHAGSVVLLFLALTRMRLAFWPSAAVAALFAVHPLRVESVAWASERKDVLSVFFGMLSLYSYAAYAEARRAKELTPAAGGGSIATASVITEESTVSGTPAKTSSPALFYAAALVCFALALMSKAMLVTLPFVFLLLDHWPLGRWTWTEPGWKRTLINLAMEKLPFVLLSVGSTWLGIAMLQGAGAIAATSHASTRQRLSYAAYGYLGYLSKTVWPVGLVLPYPRPDEVPLSLVAATVAIMFATTIGVILQLRRRPYLAVGWFWFVGALAPVSGIMQLGTQSMADRYTYFPSIGFLLAAVWAGRDWAQACAWPKLALLAPALLLPACVFGTWRQIGFWHDSETLYRHALAASRNNFVAHNGLGFELFRQGQLDAAIAECAEAVKINPAYDPAYSNLGRFLAEKKDYAAAAANLERALALRPSEAKPRNNLGNVLLLQGRVQEAFEQFNEAVRLNPDYVEAQSNLALACQKLGRMTDAIAHFRRALELKPDAPATLNNLALILATNPDPQFRNGTEAVALATRACELTGYQHPSALATLAAAYAEQGKFTEAISFCGTALQHAGPTPNPQAERLTTMLELFKAGKPFRE